MLRLTGVRVEGNHKLYDEPSGDVYYIDPRVFATVCESFPDEKICSSVEKFRDFQEYVNSELSGLNTDDPDYIYLGDIHSKNPVMQLCVDDNCVLLNETTKLSLDGFKIAFSIGRMVVKASADAPTISNVVLSKSDGMTDWRFIQFFEQLTNNGMRAMFYAPVGRYPLYKSA